MSQSNASGSSSSTNFSNAQNSGSGGGNSENQVRTFDGISLLNIFNNYLSPTDISILRFLLGVGSRTWLEK